MDPHRSGVRRGQGALEMPFKQANRKERKPMGNWGKGRGCTPSHGVLSVFLHSVYFFSNPQMSLNV